MKTHFTPTSNAQRFLAAIAALKQRGATEASWVLLTGKPGLGKTELIEWWSLHHGAIYLRAKATWTARAVLLELAEKLGIAPARSKNDLFRQVLTALVHNPLPLAVDEIEHSLRDASVLEVFRDLSDLTEIPIVIVGMDAVRTKIQRHEQISSRIHQVVDFFPATLEDIRQMAESLVELPLTWADDLIAKISRESEGRHRLVMDALAAIEREAKRSHMTHVSAADFPQSLTHDWRLRTPRRAKAESTAKPEPTERSRRPAQPEGAPA
ncbi:MAG: AAA family ATPase [Candidatus Contendobacter sp.]